MEILQIVGLGLVSVVVIILVKQQRPEIGVQLSIAVGVIIFSLVIGKIGTVLDLFTELAARAQVSQLYLTTLLKVLGIAYIAEFGAQVCRDAGEGAVASKIEFAGKILIMLMAIPIIAVVLETIGTLL